MVFRGSQAGLSGQLLGVPRQGFVVNVTLKFTLARDFFDHSHLGPHLLRSARSFLGLSLCFLVHDVRDGTSGHPEPAGN